MLNPLQANSRYGYIDSGRILFESSALNVSPADPHRQTEEQSKLATRAHSYTLGSLH
jgi:hypothetical protein